MKPKHPPISHRNSGLAKAMALSVPFGLATAFATVSDGGYPVIQAVAPSRLNLGDLTGGTALTTSTLYFWSNDAERAKIDNNGLMSIGLGTGTAATRLHVQSGDYKLLTLSTSNANSNVMITGRPTGAGANLTFNSNNSSTDANAGGFVFGTGNPDGTNQAIGTEVLRIKRTGSTVITASNTGDNGLTVTQPAGGNILLLRQGTNNRFLVDHNGQAQATNALSTGNALTVTQTPAGGNIMVLRQGTNTRMAVGHGGTLQVTAANHDVARFGTANPDANIHVTANPTGTGNLILQSNGGQNGIVFQSGSAGTEVFRVRADGYAGVMGQNIMYWNRNNRTISIGDVMGGDDGTPGAGAPGENLAFRTKDRDAGKFNSLGWLSIGNPTNPAVTNEIPSARTELDIRDSYTDTENRAELWLTGSNGDGGLVRFFTNVNGTDIEEAVIRTDELENQGGLSFQTGGHSGGGPGTKMRLAANGDLTLSGNIEVAGVKTKVWSVVPDYVFEKDYQLASLDEVDAYVRKNKHLPEVPSAKEIQAKGMDLAEMNLTLLKKVEELTLHAIRQEREMKRQAAEIRDLKASR